MLKTLRSREWVVVSVGALLAFWIVGTSSSLKNCIHERKHDKSYETIEKGRSGVSRAVARWQLNAACAGEFTDNNAAAITALATAVVALFTFTLWRVGGGQLRELRRSVTISERALTDLERAYLFFTEVTDAGFEPGADGKSIVIRTGLKYIVTNHGKTPAVLTEILQKDVILEAGSVFRLPDPIDPVQESGQKLPVGIGVGPGKPHELVYNLPLFGAVQSLKYIAVANRGNHLFFMGYIRYSDIFRKKHRTGFCLFYDVSSEQFISIGDDKYNYTEDED
jgi:hypothetical protein